MTCVRILGIDPGSCHTGFGIITHQRSCSQYVTSGCIHLTQFDAMAQRLKHIFEGISELIYQYQPDEVAIEQVFIGRNASSALKLGQARGSAIVAAVQQDKPLFEYAARQVKQAIVGRGNADKVQVQHMVMHLLKLPGYPQQDAADALAIALCHAQMRTSLARINAGPSSRRGRVQPVAAR